MNGDLIAALAGLVGVSVGGWLQLWAANRANVEQSRVQSRKEAYEKYLEGIGKLSFAKDHEAKSDALAIIAEARGRIAVCGSDAVIMKLNRLFEHGDDLHSIKGSEDASNLIKEMRSDTLGATLPGMESEYFLMVFGSGAGGNRT